MNQPFDPLLQRYPSQRYPIYARGGMVNCSSPQAAAAGLEILRRGGNAMAAAVAGPTRPSAVSATWWVPLEAASTTCPSTFI